MSAKIEEANECNGEKALARTKRKTEAEASENVSRAKRREKADQEGTSTGSSLPKTPTTIFSLNTYCWNTILSYLCLSDQLRLAASNRYIKTHCESLRHTYRHVNESVTNTLDKDELHHLLELINENVISYESSLDSQTDGGEHLWMLRTYCPNLRHLKMNFRRPRGHDLKQLKSLTSLHARLYFRDPIQCKEFALSLMELPQLKKLTLGWTHNGSGLHVLEDLEYLDITNCSAFDDECLALCFLKMKKLGTLITFYTSDHFGNIVKNCRSLERLVFRTSNEPDVICQLPRLKHLEMWKRYCPKPSFIEGLIQRTGTPLETLILAGHDLRSEQLNHVCEISSLRELGVECETVPLRCLSRLKNLEILHLTMLKITNQDLLALLEDCPLLTILNVQWCSLVTKDFVLDAIQLYSHRKIKIYLYSSSVKWEEIPLHPRDKKLIKITGEYLKRFYL
ncbi:uncharacterized protein LOC128262701 [Drosophila gunungcola]|uniref:uncharacterized protein LOC128262701 n=1 Tax=Drosophila gunungcola TaxID=103775 RepID=UPI0022E80A7C|nr:uncharacterized protein LOC128262701 [Drosophila gunungcola]